MLPFIRLTLRGELMKDAALELLGTAVIIVLVIAIISIIGTILQMATL